MRGEAVAAEAGWVEVEDALFSGRSSQSSPVQWQRAARDENIPARGGIWGAERLKSVRGDNSQGLSLRGGWAREGARKRFS